MITSFFFVETSTSQPPAPVLLSLPYANNNNSTFDQLNRKRGNDKTMATTNSDIEDHSKKIRPLLDANLEDTPPTVMKSKGSGRGRKPAHELLSEDQKKANHIASEQKRRANIRLGFDQLVGVVPNLTECQRSESLILQKSVDYIRQLVDTKNGLRDRVRELQTALGEVPDEDSSEGEMDYDF
ncbi:hypothetical protein BC941DRAFT_263960 [Chlamydoabsidia padenii]|nr:hypothetical protein BC941DRAFT_263960 [Chlamydoabsidia padenii]